jgi:hypothetical protein
MPKVKTSFSIVASSARELSGCDSSAEVEMRRAEGQGEIAESAIRLAIVAQQAQPLPWGTSIGGRSWMAK